MKTRAAAWSFRKTIDEHLPRSLGKTSVFMRVAR